MRFRYLSHLRATKAHMSMRILPVSQEPLLLAYTKYESMEVNEGYNKNLGL